MIIEVFNQIVLDLVFSSEKLDLDEIGEFWKDNNLFVVFFSKVCCLFIFDGKIFIF